MGENQESLYMVGLLVTPKTVEAVPIPIYRDGMAARFVPGWRPAQTSGFNNSVAIY